MLAMIRRAPWPLLLAVAVAAAMAGACLTQHVFWDDEAYTGILARNLLHFGKINAWDGHNLMAYRNGWTLDSHLIEKENPPLQFFVTAFSFALLGDTTLAGRLPFVLCGLLGLAAVYGWVRKFTEGTGLKPWLPVWLLALNVPFLLYIAQCRYYALVLLLVPCLLLCHAACTGAHRRFWFTAGALAALLLMLAHYISGAATLAAIGMISLIRSPHRKLRLAFSVFAGAVAGAGLVALLLRSGVLDFLKGGSDASGGMWQHFTGILLFELLDLGRFQFFAWAVLPILVLPFVWEKLRDQRLLVWRALTVMAMMAVTLVVTAAVSPQDTTVTKFADMRYALGVLVMGALPVAAAIHIAGKAATKWAGVVLAGLILFTNIPYPPSWPLRCVLCDRASEMLGNHPSGTDALLHAAADLPAGTMTIVQPNSFTLPMIFYRPDLRYINIMDPRRAIDPVERAQLPDWIFVGSTVPQAILVGINTQQPPPRLAMGKVTFELTSIEHHFFMDTTRPEIPLHMFHPDPMLDQDHGWSLFEQQVDMRMR